MSFKVCNPDLSLLSASSECSSCGAFERVPLWLRPDGQGYGKPPSFDLRTLQFIGEDGNNIERAFQCFRAQKNQWMFWAALAFYMIVNRNPYIIALFGLFRWFDTFPVSPFILVLLGIVSSYLTPLSIIMSFVHFIFLLHIGVFPVFRWYVHIVILFGVGLSPPMTNMWNDWTVQDLLAWFTLWIVAAAISAWIAYPRELELRIQFHTLSLLLTRSALEPSFLNVSSLYFLQPLVRSQLSTLFASFPLLHSIYRSKEQENASTTAQTFLQGLPQLDKLRDSLENEGTSFTPIFIIGLHRSGTTFLYETLSKLLPSVPCLTPYALLYFPFLRTIRQRGEERQMQNNLTHYFQSLGVRTRLIDRVEVSSSHPREEYGFFLQKYCEEGKPRILSESSALWIRRLCWKLLDMEMVNSNGQENNPHKYVLLKNPWCFGSEKTLLKFFPQAKFIHLERDPVQVLNSMIRAQMVLTSKYCAYLWTLRQPKATPLLHIVRLVSVVLGDDGMTRWFVRNCMKQIYEARRLGQLSLKSLNVSSVPVLSLEYESLISEVQKLPLLQQVLEFLSVNSDASSLTNGVTETDSHNVIKEQKSVPLPIPLLLPQVMQVQARFLLELKEQLCQK